MEKEKLSWKNKLAKKCRDYFLANYKDYDFIYAEQDKIDNPSSLNLPDLFIFIGELNKYGLAIRFTKKKYDIDKARCFTIQNNKTLEVNDYLEIYIPSIKKFERIINIYFKKQ